MRQWLYSLLGLTLAWQASAHMSPSGDTDPQVTVQEGRFVISFATINTDRGGRLLDAVIHEPDGRVFIPRHRVLLPELKKETRQGPPLDSPEVVLISAANSRPIDLFQAGDSHKASAKELHRAVWVEHPNDPSRRTERPLPIEVSGTPNAATLTTVSQVGVQGHQVAFLWSDSPIELSSEGTQLRLSMASLQGFAEGKTVTLGEAASIYHFPITSPPIWAANRWWVGWVQKIPGNHKKENEAWQTVLSSYEPATQKLEHKPLPGISNWNSSVSIATTNGWLCIAWHASIDGSYPGMAKIVTAFEKLPPIRE